MKPEEIKAALEYGRKHGLVTLKTPVPKTEVVQFGLRSGLLSFPKGPQRPLTEAQLCRRRALNKGYEKKRRERLWAQGLTSHGKPRKRSRELCVVDGRLKYASPEAKREARRRQDRASHLKRTKKFHAAGLNNKGRPFSSAARQRRFC